MDGVKRTVMPTLPSLARTVSSWNTLTAVIMSRRFPTNTPRWSKCQLCWLQQDINQPMEEDTYSYSTRHDIWRIWSIPSLIQTSAGILEKKYKTIHTIRRIWWQLQARTNSLLHAYIQRVMSYFWTVGIPLKGTWRYTHTSRWHIAITGIHTKFISQEQNMAHRRR